LKFELLTDDCDGLHECSGIDAEGTFDEPLRRYQTGASRKPVPLHVSVAKTLAVWRAETPYPAHEDFVFPVIRLNGKEPVSPIWC
jgi:hypothetical protein